MDDPRSRRRRQPLHWQVVCVDPQLLHQAQAALGASGPSDAIERALRQVVLRSTARRVWRGDQPLQ